MDLEIYFRPTELKEFKESSLGAFTEFYTENGFPNWEEANIAIVGVNEDRMSLGNKGTASSPDAIREQLYQLYHHNKSVNIVDLGNILPGATVEDTYHAVADVVGSLVKKNVFAIILGGSQDITYANYLAYEKLEQTVNLVCIDDKMDFGEDDEGVNSGSFLNHIILHQPCYLFNYGHVGYQSYLVPPNRIKLMDDLYFDFIRLGETQSVLSKAEPLVRNADILSVDVSCIRSSELSSNSNAGPNGFYGEEACQIMRYAGMSDKLSSVGFYEYNAMLDDSKMDAKLLGQMVWCVVDGYASRKKDYPIGTKEKYTRYRVHVEGTEHELVFYKSDKTDRWWMDVPYPTHERMKFERHHLVPCTYEDYQFSCEGNVPDLWWKTYRKLN